MPKTTERQQQAVISRISKAKVLGPLCVMDWLSQCGEHEFQYRRLTGRDFTRGNCRNCYQTAQIEIEAGHITDDELVALGLRLPYKRQLSKKILAAVCARRNELKEA